MALRPAEGRPERDADGQRAQEEEDAADEQADRRGPHQDRQDDESQTVETGADPHPAQHPGGHGGEQRAPAPTAELGASRLADLSAGPSGGHAHEQ